MKWIGSLGKRNKNKIPIFVYGTLKTGCGNDFLLNKSTFIGKAVTVKPLCIYSNGIPTVMIPTQDIEELALPIIGEAYMISFKTSIILDTLEGYPVNYDRTKVEVEIIDEESENVYMKLKALIYVSSTQNILQYCSERKNIVELRGIDTGEIVIKDGRYEWVEHEYGYRYV